MDCDINIQQLLNHDKILISSSQYPGFGGAATNAYYLIKYLKNLNKNVSGLFIYHDLNVNYNPDNLNGIFITDNDGRNNLVNKQKNQNINRKITEYFGGQPDICLCKNVISPFLVKNIFSNSQVVYLVSGSLHATFYSTLGISSIKLLKMNKKIIDETTESIIKNVEKERNSMKISDHIWFNSQLTKNIFDLIYPEICDKSCIIYDTSNYANIIDIPLKNFKRIYDLAFIASNLTRTVKNFKFFYDIINDERICKMNILIVGNNSNKFDLNKCQNITLFPLQEKNKIFELLKQTRILCTTSFFDSSPNTTKEAFLCGCKCLISKNVGNFEKYSNECVCEDVYDKEEWIDKILNIL